MASLNDLRLVRTLSVALDCCITQCSRTILGRVIPFVFVPAIILTFDSSVILRSDSIATLVQSKLGWVRGMMVCHVLNHSRAQRLLHALGALRHLEWGGVVMHREGSNFSHSG